MCSPGLIKQTDECRKGKRTHFPPSQPNAELTFTLGVCRISLMLWEKRHQNVRIQRLRDRAGQCGWWFAGMRGEGEDGGRKYSFSPPPPHPPR